MLLFQLLRWKNLCICIQWK